MRERDSTEKHLREQAQKTAELIKYNHDYWTKRMAPIYEQLHIQAKKTADLVKHRSGSQRDQWRVT